MSNHDTNPQQQPEAVEPERVIAPDEAFERLLDDNAERAWLEYCKLHGIDPTTDKEG